MNNTEFVSKLKKALDCKTLYVKGCFGAPMNAANKKRYKSNTAYNKKAARQKLIDAATADTFGFDCVCFVKGVLWGWDGDKNKTYGGASYKSNGVNDISESKMISICNDVSKDFTNIIPGEFLWMKGHCGVYVGNGLAIEATPAWKDGVQLSACNQDIKGYNRRNWTKHGKLPYIDYTQGVTKVTVTLDKLAKGSKGEQVKTMQRLLIAKGFSCGSSGADGSFGADTVGAVKKFQKSIGVLQDGICGAKTWPALLGAK